LPISTFLPATLATAPVVVRDETLIDKAERCRRLAAGISDRQAAEVLRSMALQYEDNAARVEA